MIIRFANENDFELLNKYDKHISKRELENSIKLNRVYIAEDNGIFKGWLRYNLFWDNTPFMNMLFILEEYRNSGIGKNLVTFWENNMKKDGFDTIMTSTAADEYAQHFYNKIGYKAVGGFSENEGFELIFSKRLI